MSTSEPPPKSAARTLTNTATAQAENDSLLPQELDSTETSQVPPYPNPSIAPQLSGSITCEGTGTTGLLVDSEKDGDSTLRWTGNREGKYDLPNDEKEQERLDLQHHIFMITFSDELHLAPINEIQGGVHNVLDIGTGTGIWAIEFAEKFPAVQIIGTDLSPIQPPSVPPNCSFELSDAEDEWNFAHKFEYIHGRMLLTCFQSHLPVIKLAFDNLLPGGYLELQDCIYDFPCVDDTMEGSNFEKWTQLIRKATTQLGKDWTRAAEYKNYLELIGFEDVIELKFEWPIGTWARGKRMKTLGKWCREDVLAGLEGASLVVLTRGLGMTRDEIDKLLSEVREEIESNKLHIYVPVRVVYGRKPEDLAS